MSTVQIDVEQMKELLAHAQANGTVEKWCDLAIDWMQAANDRLVQYRDHEEAKYTDAG